MSGTFFQGNGLFTVEARDHKGAQVSGEERNVVKVVQRISRKLSEMTAVASLVAISAGTPAPAAAEGLDASIVRASTSGLLNTFVTRMHVHDERNDPGHDGPTLVVRRDASNNVVCHLSMYGLDAVFARMSEGRGRLSTESAARTRALIVMHEVAHCELAASERRQEQTGKVNIHNLGARYIKSFVKPQGQMKELQERFASDLQTLVSERHADVKALLAIARLIFANVSSRSQREEGLTLFDLYVEDLMLLRQREQASLEKVHAGTFNDHDTIGVIKVVQHMVHSAGASTEGLARLQADVLDGDQPTFVAMLIALGSVRAEKKQRVQGFIEETARAVDHLNAPMRDKLGQLKDKIEALTKRLADPALEADVRREAMWAKSVHESTVDTAKRGLETSVDTVRALGARPLSDFWPSDNELEEPVRQMVTQADHSFSLIHAPYATALRLGTPLQTTGPAMALSPAQLVQLGLLPSAGQRARAAVRDQPDAAIHSNDVSKP